MKLKLDENLPHDLAEDLTDRGHDVDTVADEDLAGAKDPAVLDAATGKDRMLVTLDRGFGNVRIYQPGTHPGILVLRPVSQDPGSIIELVSPSSTHMSSPTCTGALRWLNHTGFASSGPDRQEPPIFGSDEDQPGPWQWATRLWSSRGTCSLPRGPTRNAARRR